MTREELKAHCKKEIEMCKFWAHGKDEELDNNKIYQEHKLVLELLEQDTVSKESYDHEYFLRKEFELKIDKLQRQLDKIRAEIENTMKYQYAIGENQYAEGFEKSLEIIDKYKAESERI